MEMGMSTIVFLSIASHVSLIANRKKGNAPAKWGSGAISVVDKIIKHLLEILPNRTDEDFKEYQKVLR